MKSESTVQRTTMTNFVHLHIANFYMALHYNILA